MWYKVIQDIYITAVGEGYNDTQITKAEYDEIMAKIHSAPTAPDGYDYLLRADTLKWELVELPTPAPEEPTAEEVVNILLGGEDE